MSQRERGADRDSLAPIPELPLKWLPTCNMVLGMFERLIDDVHSGEAKKRLEERYDIVTTSILDKPMEECYKLKEGADEDGYIELPPLTEVEILRRYDAKHGKGKKKIGKKTHVGQESKGGGGEDTEGDDDDDDDDDEEEVDVNDYKKLRIKEKRDIALLRAKAKRERLERERHRKRKLREKFLKDKVTKEIEPKK